MANSEIEVFYRSDQLKVSAPFDFDTVLIPEISSSEVPRIQANEDGQETEDICVQLYVEVEYDVFDNFIGLTDCLLWVEAAWSQVLVLYANDGMTLTVKTLKIWDTEDPYPSTSLRGKLGEY